ncbi:MAG: ankyrin repeat domain-containing protein [Planctomycetota bacterium]
MAHAPGWIELYQLLESGGEPTGELLERCKAGRTTHTRESMLHWYAIEGEPRIVSKLVELGFDVDSTDSGGASPIQSAAQIERWDMVRALRAAGARRDGVDSCGISYRSVLSEFGDDLPEDLRADAYSLEDLLQPGGPENVPVLSLTLTRSRLPKDAPGRPIERVEWRAFADAAPDLQVEPDEDPLACSIVSGESSCSGSISFQGGEDSDLGPHLWVFPTDDFGLRVARRIAEHFGARVEWDFEAGAEVTDDEQDT